MRTQACFARPKFISLVISCILALNLIPLTSMTMTFITLFMLTRSGSWCLRMHCICTLWLMALILIEPASTKTILWKWCFWPQLQGLNSMKMASVPLTERLECPFVHYFPAQHASANRPWRAIDTTPCSVTKNKKYWEFMVIRSS